MSITAKTIIIAAPLGCGTSRVAMLCKQQGVFMGSHPNTSHEDLDFAVTCYTSKLLDTIQVRNDTYKVWGWKFTYMRYWFDQIFPSLINPHVVYCYRSHEERCLQKPEKYDCPLIEEDYLAETAYWAYFFSKHPEVPTLTVDFNLSDAKVASMLRNFI